MLRASFAIFACLSASLLASLPRDAAACAPSVACTGPNAPAVALPQNAPIGVHDYYGKGLELVRTDVSPQLAISTTTKVNGAWLEIIPPDALVVGGSYALEDANDTSCLTLRRFTVSAPAPLPTTLGTITASAPRLVQNPAFESFCTDSNRAMRVDVRLTLSDQATPFASMLDVRPIVDGHDASQSAAGHGGAIATFLVPCDIGSGQAHPTVHARGTLPDGTYVDSNELSLDIHCDAPPAVDPPSQLISPRVNDSSSSGGCAVAAPREGAGAWAIAAGALALAGALARRRRAISR